MMRTARTASTTTTWPSRDTSGSSLGLCANSSTDGSFR
jgi:hypothetical protein